MGYKIGDSVIHWRYGLGEVTAIEEKDMDGATRQYYCVEVGPLALWVPFNTEADSPIRPLAGPDEFPALLEILRSAPEDLPDHQFLRKNALKERMEQHSLAEVCRLIRDLRGRARLCALNQNDNAVLQRIESSLVDEWVLSCDVDRMDALQMLEDLLAEQAPSPSASAE